MDEAVDHKDLDLEQRLSVFAEVQVIYGKLTPILDRSELIGSWRNSFNPEDVYQLLEDGRIRSEEFQPEHKPKWDFEAGIFSEICWTEPMPDYGITEGSWDGVCYHCMKDKRGWIVMWNGDASLLFTLEKLIPPPKS